MLENQYYLYKLSRDDKKVGWDEYSSCVVIAKNKYNAVRIHPNADRFSDEDYKWSDKFEIWYSLDDFKFWIKQNKIMLENENPSENEAIELFIEEKLKRMKNELFNEDYYKYEKWDHINNIKIEKICTVDLQEEKMVLSDFNAG